MEFEGPAHEYREGDHFRYANFRFDVEYITAGGARIMRSDEKGHVSFWVPYYVLNTFEYERSEPELEKEEE